MPSLWNDNLNLSELRLRRLCGIDIILLFYWPEVSCFFCVSFNATRLLLLLHDLSSQTYQKKNESKTKNKNIKTKTQKTHKQKKIGEMKKQFLHLHLTQVILSSKCYDLSTIRPTFLPNYNLTQKMLLSASIANYSFRGTTLINNDIKDKITQQ